MRFRVCAVGVAALFWQLGAWAAPPTPGGPTDPVTAREQLKIGYQLAQDGKCGDAIPHLQESLRLDPRAITLINLADCEEKTGKLADAMVHWADARSRAQAEGQKPIEEEATARGTALDAKVPRLTITLAKTAPPDAVVERDGVALGAPSLGVALSVDPGPHTITVKARGHVDAKQDISLKEGDKQTLEVDVGPVGGNVSNPPPPPTQPVEPEKKGGGMSPLVPIGFGVGLVGIAVGSITGVMALGKGSDAKDACTDVGSDKHLCSPDGADAASSGKTLGTVSTIAFIAGGVGVGVGVVGLFLGGKKAEKEAKAKSIDLAVGPSSLFLKGTF
jgi:hypothetical protein